MKKSVVLILLAAVLAVALLMPGCVKRIPETDVDYAGPILDNALSAIQNNDREAFLKDLGAKMKEAFTEDAFKTLTDTVNSKVGDYETKSYMSAQNQKNGDSEYTVVVYKARYSKETSDVIITASFGDEDGAKKLVGLYFNSPNLRK